MPSLEARSMPLIIWSKKKNDNTEKIALNTLQFLVDILEILFLGKYCQVNDLKLKSLVFASKRLWLQSLSKFKINLSSTVSRIQPL